MEVLVTIHSLWRWAVLLAAAGAVAAAYRFRRGPGAGALGRIYVVALDIQVLIGILLWVGRGWWRQGGFVGWVHPAYMVLALAAAHVARARERRGQQGLWLYVASLVLMLLGIPWWR